MPPPRLPPATTSQPCPLLAFTTAGRQCGLSHCHGSTNEGRDAIATPLLTSCGFPPIKASTVSHPTLSPATASAPPAADFAERPVAAMPPALASTTTPVTGTISGVPAGH